MKTKWARGAMRNWRSLRFKARPYVRKFHRGEKFQHRFPDEGRLDFDFSFVVSDKTVQRLKAHKTSFIIGGSGLASGVGGYIGYKQAKKQHKRRSRNAKKKKR